MTTYINLVSKFDDKGIKQAQSQFAGIGKTLGKSFAAVGAVAAVAGAATVAFGVSAAKGAEEAAIAQRRLDQIAQSMGIFGAEAANVSKRLGEFAEANELVVGVDADVIKATQAKLLTFKELAATADVVGGSMDRATMAALDLAAAGFGSAETNAVQLGKALQDPIKGITALARAGVTFTETEKEKIRTLVESGDVLSAQNLILASIETQVGGTAEATASAFTKMQLAANQVKDSIGEALLPVVEDFAEEFGKLAPILAKDLAPVAGDLARAFAPLVLELAPMLVRILQSLSPILSTIAKNIGPLFTALEPLVDAFFLLLDAVVSIIDQALPPVIRMLDILAPVVLELVEAFLPLVMDLLPPLIELFEAMMPIIMILVDYWTNFLIPIFKDFGEFISFTLIGVIEALADGFNFLSSVLGPLYAAIKPVLDAVLAFMGIDSADLKKEMVVDVKVNDAELKKFEKVKFTGTGGTLDFLQGMGMGGAPVVTTQTGGTTGAGAGGGKKTDNRKEIAATLKESGEAVKKAQKSYRDTVNKARDTYAKAVASINETYTAAVKSAEETRSKALTQAATDNANAIARINSDTAKKLADIVATSINRLRDAFKGAVQVNVADLFASEDVGKSVDGLVKSLRDRLQGSQQLIANSAKLAAAGFSQTFIEQVVASGVDAGNELATSILTATPETQKELMSLFGELETTSETGMDALSQSIYDGTGLATTALKELYANTLTEQTTALAEQATAYTAQQVEIMEAFDLAMQEAADTRDTALADAMKAYQDALKKAMDDFLLELDEVEKKFKAKLLELKAQKKDIDKLQAQIDAAKNVVPIPQKITPVIPTVRDTGNGTTINVNVSTDSTKSDAQVGEDIVKVINKYTSRGGALLTGRVAL